MEKRQISELETKLKSVDSRVNRQLFILLVIFLVVGVVIDKLHIKSSAANSGLILLLIAVVLHSIRAVISGKRKVAEEFGVVCSVCGKTPKAFFIMQAMRKKKCQYCGGLIDMPNKAAADELR